MAIIKLAFFRVNMFFPKSSRAKCTTACENTVSTVTLQCRLYCYSNIKLTRTNVIAESFVPKQTRCHGKASKRASSKNKIQAKKSLALTYRRFEITKSRTRTFSHSVYFAICGICNLLRAGSTGR